MNLSKRIANGFGTAFTHQGVFETLKRGPWGKIRRSYWGKGPGGGSKKDYYSNVRIKT
jgi:hypothetical protein